MKAITAGPEYAERLPNDKIEAPQRYIEYGGQVIVRTRHGTHQRFIKEGWNERGTYPYILDGGYCEAGRDDGGEARNDFLEPTQFSVYYVEDGDHVLYEVIE